MSCHVMSCLRLLLFRLKMLLKLDHRFLESKESVEFLLDVFFQVGGVCVLVVAIVRGNRQFQMSFFRLHNRNNKTNTTTQKPRLLASPSVPSRAQKPRSCTSTFLSFSWNSMSIL
mmetsp:Transcript_1253/g.2383  ORF Transcript_1253/g.2383 Transcript_1253/m.2383 type:complete len:115 (-) Transcript_1253:1868-2212(-)